MAQTKENVDLDKAYQEYLRLPAQFDSLLMATVSENGIPNASYAAYIQALGNYYVLISDLATHTDNLRRNKQVSVLFIENEQDAQHLFARQRATLLCEVDEVDQNGEVFPYIIQLFTHKFGKFIDLLQGKQDFHLFCLHPMSGTYVAGFGRAFTIEGDDLDAISHINDVGHRTEHGENVTAKSGLYK